MLLPSQTSVCLSQSVRYFTVPPRAHPSALSGTVLYAAKQLFTPPPRTTAVSAAPIFASDGRDVKPFAFLTLYPSLIAFFALLAR